jgi:hypothetical protein
MKNALILLQDINLYATTAIVAHTHQDGGSPRASRLRGKPRFVTAMPLPACSDYIIFSAFSSYFTGKFRPFIHF